MAPITVLSAPPGRLVAGVSCKVHVPCSHTMGLPASNSATWPSFLGLCSPCWGSLYEAMMLLTTAPVYEASPATQRATISASTLLTMTPSVFARQHRAQPLTGRRPSRTPYLGGMTQAKPCCSGGVACNSSAPAVAPSVSTQQAKASPVAPTQLDGSAEAVRQSVQQYYGEASPREAQWWRPPCPGFLTPITDLAVFGGGLSGGPPYYGRDAGRTRVGWVDASGSIIAGRCVQERQ